jgi:ribosomal protein S18 acetylase RimI-like enzyme
MGDPNHVSARPVPRQRAGGARGAGGAGPTFTISAAGAPDAPDLAGLYARAFADNPAYHSIFLCDNADDTVRALTWLFVRRVQILTAAGNAFWVARDGAGAAVGAVGLVAPHRRPGLLTLLLGGMAAWPYVWGMASLRRALDLDGHSPAAGAADAGPGSGGRPRGAPWELVMMAVEPEAQGQGIGSALLREALAALDAAAGGGGGGGGGAGGRRPACVLSTQQRHAVRMYERAGFVVRHEGTVQLADRRAPPFVSWAMERAAGPG